MTDLRLTRAKKILQQAKTLSEQVKDNIRTQSFSSDDVCMQAYNDLIGAAANLFPEDPILNGQMIKMPDAVVQMYNQKYGGWLPLESMPPELPSQRTEERLTRLINRLDILLGEEPTKEPVEERDFIFITDKKLQVVLILDYVEAQKAFIAEAYKACGLLCGGLIEGLLLDIVQRPDVVTKQQLDEVAKRLKLPRIDKSVDWDKVSMTVLIKISNELGLIGITVQKFAEGARDVRDTVHPRAEVRQGHRVFRDEAEILLKLVKLIYNDLIAKFGKN